MKELLSIYVEKRQSGGRNSQKGVACPISPSMGSIFVGRGRGISAGLANQLGRRFRVNTKLVRGVIGYIGYLRPIII